VTDVESSIRRFIVREIMFQEDESILKYDDLLLDSGIIDSVGITSLVLFLEEEFDVSIPLEYLVPKNFTTIEAIANLLKEWPVESHQ